MRSKQPNTLIMKMLSFNFRFVWPTWKLTSSVATRILNKRQRPDLPLRDLLLVTLMFRPHCQHLDLANLILNILEQRLHIHNPGLRRLRVQHRSLCNISNFGMAGSGQG